MSQEEKFNYFSEKNVLKYNFGYRKISEIIEKSTEDYKKKARDLLSTLDSENIEKKIISAEEIFKFSDKR